MSQTLFTIGYERATPTSLIDALSGAGVKLLIDVRELANSRRPGFSKRALAGSLSEAGIGYVHLRALGTPKAGRQANHAGRMEEFRAIVEAGLDRPEAGLALAEARELAAAQPACLFCLEDDPARCHRTAVAARLTGFAVRHLHAPPPPG